MTKYEVKMSSKFKHDLKRCKKSGLNLIELYRVISILADGGTLSEKYCDHNLKGKYSNCRECHISPDWLLIYRINNDELILTLAETGSHSDLFGM